MQIGFFKFLLNETQVHKAVLFKNNLNFTNKVINFF